jgi:hypothetical protein
MSLGNRSGVNWMRRKVQPMDRAKDLASTVLPTPGTSSIKVWPRHNRAINVSSTASRLPTMTRSTFATTCCDSVRRSAIRAALSVCRDRCFAPASIPVENSAVQPVFTQHPAADAGSATSRPPRPASVAAPPAGGGRGQAGGEHRELSGRQTPARRCARIPQPATALVPR